MAVPVMERVTSLFHTDVPALLFDWWTVVDIIWNDIQVIVIPSDLPPWGTNNV